MIFFKFAQKQEDIKFLSTKLVHLLQVSCGFCADVTTLLLDTTRKSFVFEDEVNGMIEQTGHSNMLSLPVH